MRFIGLECKPTIIRGVVCDSDGKILTTANMEAYIKDSVLPYFCKIQSLINALTQSYEKIDGVAITTDMSYFTGDNDSNAETGTLCGIDLHNVVASVLNAQVIVASQGSAAAAGEAAYGNHQNLDKIAVITIDICENNSSIITVTVINNTIEKTENDAYGEVIHKKIATPKQLFSEIAKSFDADFTNKQVQINFFEHPDLASKLYAYCKEIVTAMEETLKKQKVDKFIICGDFIEWYTAFEPILKLLSEETFGDEILIERSDLGINSGCLGVIKMLENTVKQVT